MSRKSPIRKAADALLPRGTTRREAFKKLYHGARQLLPYRGKKAFTYDQWIEKNEPILWTPVDTVFEKRPLVSIVVPVYNTPDKYLLPLVESLKAQHYANWQLCLADGSTQDERANRIAEVAGSDARISYERLKENRGIVGNTNEAIKLAKGDFIGFLDHDDVLSPFALHEVVAALNKNPKTDLFYSDEDKLSDDGTRRSQPFFKPGWSPALLEGVNYITHFVVVRRKILDKVGGLRDGFDGAQDYDFMLRVTDATENITHIPKILYHWRMAEGSTAGAIGNKNYADDAGIKALRDHVKRKNLDAKVLPIPDQPTNYRLKYNLSPRVKVSIIIPFKDKPDLLKQCVGSILSKTTHKKYELILVSNNSTEKKTHDYLDSLKKYSNVRVYYYDHPFNFSAVNNFGRSKARGEYLVLLNNDTKVITGDWLNELVGVASQPGVGAVGPMLLYPTNKIQHAGVVLGLMTMAGHVFRMLRDETITPFGRPYWPRNYLAVTAACLAIKASKYDEVGGLDEKLVMCGNDVAMGIRLHEKGYKNVYWPFARLYHYENVSVGSYNNAPPGDFDRSLIYYKPYLDWNDPYFNPNLDLLSEQIAIREHYEQS